MRLTKIAIALFMILGGFALLPGYVFSQTFKIGIITDQEPSNRLTGFTEVIRTEIQKTLGATRTVEIDPAQVFSANWDPAKAKTAYQILDLKCDLILLLGSMTTEAVLKREAFNTPTIALGVFAPEIQGIPITPEGTSGIKNFSFVLNSKDPLSDLLKFQSITDFKELAFIYFGKMARMDNEQQAMDSIAKWEEKVKANISLIALDQDNVNESFSDLSDSTDGAYLAIPYELGPEKAREVAEFFIEKKIPTFTMNKSYVDQGIMAGNSDENGVAQMLRKVAIMADEVAQNQNLSEIKVALNEDKELFLNMVTARRIEFSPPFEVIFTANLQGDLSQLERKKLSLPQILEIGLSENLGIKISQQDILLTEQDIKSARSQFLPDADYGATLGAINEGRANALLGQSQFSFTGKGTLSQLIYAEQALANVQIQKLLKQAQIHATDQQILDITLDAMDSYLSVLKAQTNVTIQSENLENSRTNLKLAKRRESLGAASNADVFRWKGEVATGKQNLIEAQTGLITAKAQLNALLNGVPGSDFELQDLTLEGPLFQAISNSDLAQYVKGPFELALIGEFLTSEAKLNYPTKKQLLSNSKVLERQRKMNKRLYYTPSIAAQAQLDNTFWRGGEASDPGSGSEFINNNWNAGLNVSIPIFDGNRRSIDLQTTGIQQEQLAYQIENLDRNLELSVRANSLSLLAATTNIDNSKVSAENTAKNYTLVQNLYKKGQISIIQLIDAQRAALQTKQGYAIAVYDYLIAFLRLENSIGAYTMLSSEEERTQFQDRWEKFLSNQKEENLK